MTARRIFCEGPDDHSPLRELIRRRFSRRVASLNQANTRGSRLTRDGADDLDLVPLMSRDKLLTSVAKVLAGRGYERGAADRDPAPR